MAKKGTKLESLQAEIAKLEIQEKSTKEKLLSIQEKLKLKQTELEQVEQNEKEKMLEQTFKNLSQFDISRIKKMFAVKEKITQFLNMLLTCEDISTTLDLIKDTISLAHWNIDLYDLKMKFWTTCPKVAIKMITKIRR